MGTMVLTLLTTLITSNVGIMGLTYAVTEISNKLLKKWGIADAKNLVIKGVCWVVALVLTVAKCLVAHGGNCFHDAFSASGPMTDLLVGALGAQVLHDKLPHEATVPTDVTINK